MKYVRAEPCASTSMMSPWKNRNLGCLKSKNNRLPAAREPTFPQGHMILFVVLTPQRVSTLCHSQ